jgi:acyl-CoA thioesterase I
MERKDKDKGAVTAVATIVIACMVSVAAFAQDAVPTPPPPPSPSGSTDLPPYSKECQGGGTPIVIEAPLLNVAAAVEKRKAIRILAIGASSGRRASGYIAQVEIMLRKVLPDIDVVMVNRGVSGELAANAEARIKTEVALTDADLVIWQVGTNDALAYVPIEELRTTVGSTVRWLKDHNVDVVLAGLQYVAQMAQDDHYQAVRNLLRDLAAQENIMIVRRYEAMRFFAQTSKSGPSFISDEFGRTEVSYNCLAEYIAGAISLGVLGKNIPTTEPQGSSPP